MPKEDTQFKPGQSGNPKGYPKGKPNRGTVARRWLAQLEAIENPITKKKEELTQEEIMTLAIIGKARKGDVRAYKQLMDSAHGKAKETIDHTSKGEKITGVTFEVVNGSPKPKDD